MSANTLEMSKITFIGFAFVGAVVTLFLFAYLLFQAFIAIKNKIYTLKK